MKVEKDKRIESCKTNKKILRKSLLNLNGYKLCSRICIMKNKIY